MEMAESDAAERSPGMSFTKRLQDRDRGCCITGRSIEGVYGCVVQLPFESFTTSEAHNSIPSLRPQKWETIAEPLPLYTFFPEHIWTQ